VLRLSDEALDLQSRGFPARAEPLLRRAARQAAGLPANHPDAPTALGRWAYWLLHDGIWESAAAVALRAADRARDLGDTPEDRAENARREVWYLWIRADACRLTGDAPGAREALRRAWSHIEAEAPRGMPEAELALVEALLALDDDRPGDALPWLDRAKELPSADPAGGALQIELARVEALAASGRRADAERSLAAAHTLARTAADRADVHQREALTAQLAGEPGRAWAAAHRAMEFARSWIADAPDAGEQALRQRRTRPYLETLLDLALHSPAGSGFAEDALALTLGFPPPALRPGEALVAWHWGGARVLGFLREGPSGSVRPFSAGAPEELREWILLYRACLADPARSEDAHRVGQILSKRLLPFAEALLPERILAAPDGILEGLALAALPIGGLAEPLGIRCSVIRITSATVTERPADDSVLLDLLVLAAPSPPAGAIPATQLVGAEREGARIAAESPDAEALCGEAATEARLSAKPAARILHIAAHTGSSGGAAGLLLAPGADDDGVLTPAEAAALPHPPRLVILSGCETLLADVPGRRAVGDIGTAFLMAGAETVVGALWKVDDQSTTRFMERFHRNLRTGVRPSEALRETRRQCAESRRKSLADPFTWAAFVVRGRDLPPGAAPPPRPGRRGAWWLGVPVALVAGAVLLRRRTTG
jgi:CHAT domain-containing protein